MEETSACTLDCPDSCSLLITVHGDTITNIAGNPMHPVTAGFTCRKIKDFSRRLRSPSRLTKPLLRAGSAWKPIGWDDALDLCAEKIDACRKEPASILHLHGDGAKGVLKQASRLFFAMLGSSRAKGALCDAAGFIACVNDFGSRFNNDIADLVNARRIVNWGKDLSRSSIHTAAYVRQARLKGARVLTISPGGDGNASFSDAFVRVRPGTDRFLAAAVIRRFIESDRISPNVLAHARNWDTFRRLIVGRSAGEFAASCDVSLEDIDRIFACYNTDEPVATIIGAGLQRYACGGENVRFINALAMLSGNVGRSGGGSYFHLHSMRNVNLNWTKDPEGKPQRTLLWPTIGRDILEAVDPPIRMLWVNGSNVVNQAPDSHGTAGAFESVEFKVVVDAFMTDTAERADLVLPCTLMLEQEDIAASYLHDFVHHSKRVVKGPGEVRSDYWILSELGKRLDPPIELPDPETCFRASLDAPFLGFSLEELREKGFCRAKRPLVAYENMHFDHPDGKYRFPTSLHGEPDPPPHYPLRLLTLIRREAIHSQILPEKQSAPPTVWVDRDSPALRDLDLNRDLFLVSPHGRLRIRLQFADGLHPSVVLYRRGDWMKLGGGANQLIGAGLTDIGNGAPFYQQWVRLENDLKNGS